MAYFPFNVLIVVTPLWVPADTLRPPPLERTPDCVQWDLRDVPVAPSIAWDGKDLWHFDPPEFWKQMSAALARLGKEDVHQHFDLKRTKDALLHKMAMNNEQGLFLLFHGDSFLRMTYQNLLYALVGTESRPPPDIIIPAHQSPQLICCSQAAVAMAPSAKGCSIHFGQADNRNSSAYDIPLNTFQQTVRRYVSNGDVCAVWTMYEHFGGDLHDFTSGPDAITPDLYAVNGGLHYVENFDCITHRCGPGGGQKFRNEDFEHDLRKRIDSFAEHISSSPGSSTQFVVVSSSWNSWGRWEDQAHAYEHMRSVVSNLPPTVKDRTPYIDFHTLVGTDACGFTNKFPAFRYEMLETPDPCGHHYINKDPHLHGGAYKYLLELLLNLMSEGQRRCDPVPHSPSLDRIIDTDDPHSSFIATTI